MHSASKRVVREDELTLLVAVAFGEVPIVAVEEFKGGYFNTAYGIDLADGTRTVLKVAPCPGTPLLTYEADAMRSEVAFYELVRGAGALPMPDLLFVDTSGSVIDSDYLFLSRLEGDVWNDCQRDLSDEDTARLRCDLGQMAGRLHHIKGTRFGYMQPGTPSGATWDEAFAAMIEAVLADADRFGASLPCEKSAVRRALGHHRSLLAEVRQPALLHFDMWAGNIFLTDGSGGVRSIEGVIDGERTMWGDPVAELAGCALFSELAEETPFLTGYAQTAPQPIEVTPGVESRLALYRVYLDLLMLVEAVPRAYGEEFEPTRRFVTRDLLRQLDRLE